MKYQFLSRGKLIEGICEHGVGHPTKNNVQCLERLTGDDGWGIHGCDGCCSNKDFPHHVKTIQQAEEEGYEILDKQIDLDDLLVKIER